MAVLVPELSLGDDECWFGTYVHHHGYVAEHCFCLLSASLWNEVDFLTNPHDDNNFRITRSYPHGEHNYTNNCDEWAMLFRYCSTKPPIEVMFTKNQWMSDISLVPCYRGYRRMRGNMVEICKVQMTLVPRPYPGVLGDYTNVRGNLPQNTAPINLIHEDDDANGPSFPYVETRDASTTAVLQHIEEDQDNVSRLFLGDRCKSITRVS